ncbi:MAG: hypothetical protein KR126chlam3_00502 [Chlamydiae bacterium]|nr:hypothetical protein [Chlamydiota bacterium]
MEFFYHLMPFIKKDHLTGEFFMSGVGFYSWLKSWVALENSTEDQAVEGLRGEMHHHYEEEQKQVEEERVAQNTRQAAEQSLLEKWLQSRDAALDERRKTFESRNIQREPPEDVHREVHPSNKIEDQETERKPLYESHEVQSAGFGSTFGRSFGKHFGRGFGKGDQ